MNILILGPQGSGKGTQAQLLAEKFGLFYFESGEFLRKLAEENTTVRETINKGEFVPEEEFASYVSAFFDEKQIYENIIFDGFPRELDQYIFFKKWLQDKKIKLDVVVVLEVSKEISLKRLLKRNREDDTPKVIEERLNLFIKETLPLIAELKKETKVVEIDGEGSVEEIFKNICEKLN